MSRWIAAALAIIGFALAASYWIASVATAKPAPKAGSVVKIINGPGHGSGVHIGNGYILTAAHVTKGAESVEVLSDDGKTTKAEILWSSSAYDVTLLRADIKAKASPLSCREPYEGEAIRASGNPYDQKFVSASGHVAGAASEYSPWKRVFVVGTTMVHGMSGGPTFDARGNVIGINVGVMVVSVGMASYVASFGYIVPSSSICGLMGRAVPA